METNMNHTPINGKNGDVIEKMHARKDADKLRAEAAQHDRDAYESFERCDTDGFMSQWASGLTASKKRLEANLIENGGVTDLVGPVTVDGEPVRFRTVDTRYGRKWLVLDDNDDAVAWLDPSAVRMDTYRKKGYTLGQYQVTGIAKIVGNNAANCAAAIVPWYATTDVNSGVDKLAKLIAVCPADVKYADDWW